MSTAALHAFGRKALLAAWSLTGEEPSLAELQIAGAVADFESGYGTATFKNVVTGETHANTNNWGSVQAGRPLCGPGTFEATDTSPSKVSADNPRGEYQSCFLSPATPAEGAAIFLRQITLRRPESWAAMRNGDIDRFSTEMHTRHGAIGAYYEGFGATPAIQIDHHAHAVEQGVIAIAQALGEPVMARRGGPSSLGGGAEGVTLEDVAACLGGVFLMYSAGRVLGARRHS